MTGVGYPGSPGTHAVRRPVHAGWVTGFAVAATVASLALGAVGFSGVAVAPMLTAAYLLDVVGFVLGVVGLARHRGRSAVLDILVVIVTSVAFVLTTGLFVVIVLAFAGG